jgi:chemotaxis protein CheX
MDFDVDSLSAMAADIWSSMLGVDLTPGNGAMASLGETNTMTACVQIGGDWTGAVTVCCPTTLAQSFAGAMFACEGEDLALDEVKDALGELTNMTGGSIKGMIPGECQLSIPAVAEGHDYSLSIPHGVEAARLDFETGGQPLRILIYATS